MDESAAHVAVLGALTAVLVVVPAGKKHNFLNTGENPLILYTVYGPPEHADGAVHHTKEEADAAEESGGEVLAGEYQLEVGSPGVDRPLTEPRHWRRNVGRLVAVNTQTGEQFTGRIASATDDEAVLEVNGAERSVQLREVETALVQVELNRPVAEKEG